MASRPSRRFGPGSFAAYEGATAGLRSMTDLFAPTIANGEEKPSLEASDDKPYWHLPVEPAWLLS